MTNLRRFALFVFVCGALCSGSRDERVLAQKDIRVTAVVLKADDGRPSGKCPLAVKFNGTVTADRAGVVTYTFARSDGATGPSYTLNFDKAGTMPVSTEWTLGDASALPHYEGWVAIRIVSPTLMESSHDTGSFVLNCSGAPAQGKASSDKKISSADMANFKSIIERDNASRAQKHAERIAWLSDVAKRSEDKFRVAFEKAGVNQKQLGAELETAVKAAQNATSPEAGTKILQDFGTKRVPLFEKMMLNLDAGALRRELNDCKQDAPGQSDIRAKIVDAPAVIAAICTPAPPAEDPTPTPTPTPTPHSGVYDEFDISGPFPMVYAQHYWYPGTETIQDNTVRLTGGEFSFPTGAVHHNSLIQTQTIYQPITIAGPWRRIEVTPVFAFGSEGRLLIHNYSFTFPPGFSNTGVEIEISGGPGMGGGTAGDFPRTDRYSSWPYLFRALAGEWTNSDYIRIRPPTLLLSSEGWSERAMLRPAVRLKMEMTTTGLGAATITAFARIRLDHFHVIVIR